MHCKIIPHVRIVLLCNARLLDAYEYRRNYISFEIKELYIDDLAYNAVSICYVEYVQPLNKE